MKIKLKRFAFIILIFAVSHLAAQTLPSNRAGELSRGESLFKENNAKDAVQVLEYEIMNGQLSENTYNFLGLGYYQLGEYDKSLDAFRRGLKAQPENKKLLSYNMGNTYYALKEYKLAAECYSDAIQAEPLFYEALLNRANALLMAGQLVSAKEDYEAFIEKCPDDPQKERIELLLKALEEEIARREEEARLLAEQNKAQWEEYQGDIAEKKSSAFTPDWEEIESMLDNNQQAKDNPEWEKIHNENPEPVTDPKASEKVTLEDEDRDSGVWEEFENEGSTTASYTAEKIEEEPLEVDWLTFSDEDLEEMKELEKESREEHERWLEEERRRNQEIANREAQQKQREQQQSLEDEKRLREQLLEDMRKSEDERRKKLLEDVANSLQGTDSTNLTSGAEDLIEYDLEGELD